MAKIKFIGIGGSLRSGGIKFVKGIPYDVSDEVAEYLISTFGEEYFKLEEAPKKAAPKAKAKPAPKKEEVKVVVEDDEEVN